MANVNAPFGLKPVRMANGSKNIPVNEYTIADNYSTKIYNGDIVELSGTSRNVTPSAAGNADNIGVFLGCYYEDINGDVVFSNYYPGDANATNIKCMVADDPSTVFQAMADSVAVTDYGNLADIAYTAGSTVYGNSKVEVDISAGVATTGKTLRVLGLSAIPGNTTGAYAIVDVMIYEHALAPAAGVGV